MEDCKLPMDEMIEILARLPVKSLMRFKCVCIFFYDLIKNNHHFKDKHYECRKGKSHGAVIQLPPVSAPRPNQVFNLVYKESECDDVICMYLDLPNSNTRFVKCCHGMLCLILGRGDLNTENIFDILILNPFTREIKALPSLKVPDKPPNTPLVIYFGFGLSNNRTWKIIMLLSFGYANRSFRNADRKIKDSHVIVMVCSQVGDLWSWRQIDVAPALYISDLLFLYHDMHFYFKGKYYWMCAKGHLVWFDMDDEVFGKTEVPPKVSHLSVMNESIAGVILSYTENKACTEIWVMDENNNNNINWHKQASIFSSYDIQEYFVPIGFWNPSGHLLVFSGHIEIRYTVSTDFYGDHLDQELYFKEGFGPNLISIDLETQEKKTIFTSQERKNTLNIGSNPAGHVQVCSGRSLNQTQEWNSSNIFWFPRENICSNFT